MARGPVPVVIELLNVDVTVDIEIVPLPGVSTRPLGYRFLHTLELFDDRMLLVDLDRSWLRLAA